MRRQTQLGRVRGPWRASRRRTDGRSAAASHRAGDSRDALFQLLVHALKLSGPLQSPGREAKAGIASWMAFYNLQRPHQALGNRTPMAVWRDGTTGGLDGQAVDMTLVLRTSLDNAGALPTSPQPPQQQQDLVA